MASENEKEEDKEQCHPVPFSLQSIDPVVAMVDVPGYEGKKRYKR